MLTFILEVELALSNLWRGNANDDKSQADRDCTGIEASYRGECGGTVDLSGGQYCDHIYGRMDIRRAVEPGTEWKQGDPGKRRFSGRTPGSFYLYTGGGERKLSGF